MKIINEIPDFFRSTINVGIGQTISGYLTLFRLYLPKRFKPFSYSVRWNAFLMFKEIFLSRDYFFENVNNNPYIIDAGGNIGISSMFFKKMYPQSEIITFEPDEYTRRVLERNVAKLNIKIEPYALADKQGLIDFYHSDKNPGGSSSYPKKDRIEEFKKVSVQTEALSHYVTKRVDILKMDIEGAEGVVLNDLEKTGKLELVQNIALEYHLSDNNKLSDIIKIMERSGMRISFGKSIFDNRRFFDSYFILRGTRN